MAHPDVYLAFRFHVNFYHSYRGDRPDDEGFGQDIRIIRHIIHVLDTFNDAGVAVRATWDIENLFSLEEIMPTYCPDIIAALQRRVREAGDEIEVMSYNNGLISAHTAEEFEGAIAKALDNEAGSGLHDLFETVRPIVRPQEMMYTPLHLKLYRHYGIEAISLFYSAVPFNAFSTFIAPLPVDQAHNPLTLAYPGIDETLTLLPARNHGDIADRLSLRRWVKQLQRQQRRMTTPTDLLLLIDADADDTYWTGYDWPLIRQLLPIARGLEGLLASVADLDGTLFTTPYDYLQTHEPRGTILLGQDTADGAFDGYASWADKWPNHRLWTGIERARILALQARRLVALTGDTPAGDVANADAIAHHLDAGVAARLRALSTTHFGLAAPVMNRSRLEAGATIVESAVNEAKAAFDEAAALDQAVGAADKTPTADPTFALLDYTRGVSTEAVTYTPHPSRALVRISMRLSTEIAASPTLVDDAGDAHPSALHTPYGGSGRATAELLFVTEMAAEAQQIYRLSPQRPTTPPLVAHPVMMSDDGRRLQHDTLALTLDSAGQAESLRFETTEMATHPFVRSAVRYHQRMIEIGAWRIRESTVLGDGLIGIIRVDGEASLGDKIAEPLKVRREYLLAAGLPYLYVTTEVHYPSTPDHAPNRDLVRRLGRAYDDRWQEVMPCEIRPALYGERDRPLRVWKHNYLDHVSCYDLDYGAFSCNGVMDAFNNHVTHGWVAVSDGARGLLVAQSADATASFAFCPMRTRRLRRGVQRGYRIVMNPFGSYWGRQLHYPTAQTGLGKLIAERMAETLQPWAPSYNGHRETVRLLLSPYHGDCPPTALQHDAAAFAYPYIVLSSSPAVQPPAHRSWSMDEASMGDAPINQADKALGQSRTGDNNA